MNQISPHKVLQLLWYTLPITIVGIVIFISKLPTFEVNASQLAPAITIDLIVTLPLVYYFVIRKKPIPKTTIVPVLIIGIVIASFIIPIEHQNLLTKVKFWILPFVELFVISYVIITIRKSVKVFKSQTKDSPDFFLNIKMALGNIMPEKLVPFAAMEFSAFYYGFIKWHKTPLSKYDFTYHKESGTRAVLIVLLFLVAVETFALHLLLVSWSPVIAWILTGLSIYSGFQILGILKSLIHRPISMSKRDIAFKYGIIADANVSFENIENIAFDRTELDQESAQVSFSPLGAIEGHNVRIKLKSPITICGFYGFKKQATELALFLDEPARFVESVRSKIA